MEQDLFENYEDLPTAIQAIYNEAGKLYCDVGLSYVDCHNFVNAFKEQGYTCEYDLSAELFNLREMTQEEKEAHQNKKMFNNKKFLSLVKELYNTGIKTYYVGGCVRDKYMGNNNPDDIDVCVVGVENVSRFLTILSMYADNVADQDGEGVGNFPVWIAEFDGVKVDFALARKEQKDGMTRKDFLVDTSNVSIEDDLLRRDLTVNAIAINCFNGEVVDPYNGVQHINEKVAHPVSEAFKDDPLRVIRAARFIARFNFVASKELIYYCTFLTPKGMANERVGEELHKLFKQNGNPFLFFEFLNDVGWTNYFFKNLNLVFNEDLFDQIKDFDVFTKTVLTFLGTPIDDVKRSLRKIRFLNGKEQKRIFAIINFLTTFHYSRENTAIFKRELESLGMNLNDILTSIEFSNYIKQDDYINLLQVWDEIQTIPIVTGEILMEYGYQEGVKLGKIKKKMLSLQDKGFLTIDNYKKYIDNDK